MECFNCSSVPEQKNLFFLPKCGHPCCQNCLANQHGTELTCSACNLKIPETTLDSLPKYLLGYPMMKENIVHQSCVICNELHPATKFCLDCNEAYCDDFAEMHSRQRISSKHVVVPIEEFDQHQKANHHLGFLHHKSCIQHNRPFDFLDLEIKSHNKLVCSDCLAGKHTSLAGLGDCASSLLQNKLDHIRELGSEGSAHLAQLQEEEERLSSRLKVLKESRDRSLSEIRRVFGSLHEALQTRQAQLEREVKEFSKSSCFQLTEERERSRVWQGQLSLLEKCVEEINQNPPPLPSEMQMPPSSLSSSSSSESPGPHFLSTKALMVDACLLEDALRSSLSSSRASSSLTDVQSQLRVSEIRDQIEFSFHFLSSVSPLSSHSPSSSSSSSSISITQPLKEEDKLGALLHRISSMFSVNSVSCLSPSTSSSPSRVSQSDWSKNKVQSVMTFYSKGNGANQLSAPNGMTYSPDSKLFYVSDYSNNRIQVFRNHPQAELEGRVEIEFLPPLGSSPISSDLALSPPYTAPPSASSPLGICYHEGQLFIADFNNHRVQVWRAEDGSFLRMIGTGSAGSAVGQLNFPYGCTVYQNHLFVSEYGNHRIQKFSLSDSSVVKVIGSQGNGLGQLSYPRENSVLNGKLYVADSGNHRISVFDPESGAALSVIGPSLPNDGNLSSPLGLLFSHNLLFVSSQHRISVFDSDHNYLYSFGSSGSGAGQFSSPRGMVMVDDKLYICDNGNGRIQVMEQKIN